MTETLLTIAIVVIVAAALLWAANTYIPMDPRIKQILNIIVVVVLVLWLLQAFGIVNFNIRLK